MTKAERRLHLATVTLRTLASDIRTTIEGLESSAAWHCGEPPALDRKKVAEGLKTWHALIAQELGRLKVPNTAPTIHEIDATTGDV